MSKYFFPSLLLLMCLVSCGLDQPVDPIRAEMEQYAKAHMETFSPDTYEFESMRSVRQYKYVDDLECYRTGLQQRCDQDREFCDKEFKKINSLEHLYGNEVACTEFVFNYWAKTETGTKIPLMVFSIYDASGTQLFISTKREQLPSYPALQILKNKGEL